MDFKKTFGFGALKDEGTQNELTDYFSQGFTPKKEMGRFDRTMSRVITKGVREFVVKWLIECLQKYSEAEFHRRLNPFYCIWHNVVHHAKDWDRRTCQQFDFIDDMKMNHVEWHAGALKTARRLSYRNWLQFDETEIFQRIEGMLMTKYGWHLLEHERKVIWIDILKMKADIYGA